MAFPIHRYRRLRQSEGILRMVRETSLSTDDLVEPFFVCEGADIRQEISSMPGVYRLSIKNLVSEVKAGFALGIPAVILFGIPDKKDDLGSEAYNPNGIVQRAISEIKNAVPEIVVITDVCIDEYTDHGHCGIVNDGQILNDATLELLSKMAFTHAEAGADIVAPSDMMDGRVGRIRKALDDNNFHNTLILSYAAKYASKFYGPFRDAISSSGNLKGGSKSTYQMDIANSDEALREVALDIHEGADMVMIKPGMPYLDIIQRVKSEFKVPTFAYQVSGEYAMIKGAIDNNWLDSKVIKESLLSFKRAGADGILTYFAKEIAEELNNE